MSVTYTYDLADRLTAIATASGSTTSFTLDALGRHATQTVSGQPTQTYSYLGKTDTIVSISSTTGTTTTTTTSAIDADGNRVATTSGGSFGFLIADLHGNMIGAIGSGITVTDAFAYDAYGNVVASVTSSLPTPWRYQGRMLESAAGTPALYDFSARSYSPAIGTFTSLDTTHGSAMNPALLNGYLYADANPATLVDPDGHCAWNGLECEGTGVSTGSLSQTTTAPTRDSTSSSSNSPCVYSYCPDHRDTDPNSYGTESTKLNSCDEWGGCYQTKKCSDAFCIADNAAAKTDNAAAKTDGMTDAQIEAQMSVDFQNSCYAGDTTDPTVPCPPKLDPDHPEDWPSLKDYLAANGDVADYYHEVYQASYDKTFSAMRAKGYSPIDADQAAKNMANINVGSDSGVFADRVSRGFSYLGMIYDTAKTVSECHNQSAVDCAWAAEKSFFTDYALYKTITIAEEACVAGEEMGPEGCAAMAATAGLLLDPDFWQVVIADLPDLSEYCEYAAPVDPGQGDGEGGVCNS